MWDDYGVIRPGRMPFDVYENGQIVFTQNPVAFDAPIGTVVGTIAVINAAPTYKLSVGQNPYFAISGNNLVSKAALVGGVDFVQIFAIKGFKRIAAVARIVVSGSAAPPAPLPGTFSIVLNLSGGEGNSGFPDAVEMGYWISRGVPSFRIPFSWPALQTTPFAALNSAYLAQFTALLAAAASVGAKLIPDLHGFGSGPGGIVGTVAVPISAFVDVWRKLAAFLRADPNFHVIEAYDPMNEWAGMDPANPSASSTPAGQAIILQASHDVLFGLRGDGDNTPLYLEWDHFDGAWDAVLNNIGQLFDLILTDPARNSKGSVHCYPDRDSSGGHFNANDEQAAAGLAPPGLSTNINIIAQRMAAVVALAAQKGVALFLGETGISSDAPQLGGSDTSFWTSAGDAMFAYCQANNIQVAVWAGGKGFGTCYKDYAYNPAPTNVVAPGVKDFSSAGLQSPQTALIEKYTGFSGAQPTIYRLDAPFGVTPYAPPGTAIPGFKARYGGKITSTKSFTPSATLADGTDAAGTFNPNPITMAPGLNGLAPFSYTPAGSHSAITIKLQSTSGLTDPPGVGCSSLVDFFTGIGSIAPNVYATRRLVSSYVGAAFRLQRASDGAQMDFFFNTADNLPRQAIQDWANSRTITILTEYDQSGNAAHQNYSSGQKVLILVDTDGYPSVKWVTRARADVPTPSNGKVAMSIYVDVNPNNTGDIATQDNLVETFRLTPTSFSVDDNGGPLAGGSVPFTGSTTGVWQELAGTYSSLYATNNLKAYRNGALVSQASVAQFANNGGSSFSIGDFQFGDQHYDGSYRAMIVHYVEYQASDWTTLSAARNAYFSTPLPDTLSAVNPTIAGAGPLSVVAGKTSQPFSGITIRDDNTGSPTDSITISLSGTAGGSLTGTGLSGSGPYTLSSDTAANITTKLKALVYTPAGVATTSELLSITAASSAGTSASNSATVVSVIAASAAETPFAAPAGTFTPIGNKSGVNLSGGEKSYPETDSRGFDYAYPFAYEVDYWSGQGFGIVRLPTHSRRLQPSSYGALDPVGRTDEFPSSTFSSTYPQTVQNNLLALQSFLTYARSKGMYVIFDIHDFGFIFDTFIGDFRNISTDVEGENQFRDLCIRLWTKFKNFDNILWDFQNEPVGMSAAQWQVTLDKVFGDISSLATSTVNVLIEGGGNFSGAHDWVSSGNGAAWAGYVAPTHINIVAYQPHQYLDSDDSGSHTTVVAGKGATVLAAFTGWARTNSVKGLLGETGWSPNDSQVSGGLPSTEGAALMNYMKTNSDVFIGYTYWLGGEHLFYGDYVGASAVPPTSYMYSASPIGYPGYLAGTPTNAPQTTIMLANIL